MEQVKGYRSVRSSRLNELGAWGTELVHEKSGAKICCIENPEDSNKVFAITFRTPPQDDTGPVRSGWLPDTSSYPQMSWHSKMC